MGARDPLYRSSWHRSSRVARRPIASPRRARLRDRERRKSVTFCTRALISSPRLVPNGLRARESEYRGRAIDGTTATAAARGSGARRTRSPHHAPQVPHGRPSSRDRYADLNAITFRRSPPSRDRDRALSNITTYGHGIFEATHEPPEYPARTWCTELGVLSGVMMLTPSAGTSGRADREGISKSIALNRHLRFERLMKGDKSSAPSSATPHLQHVTRS